MALTEAAARELLTSDLDHQARVALLKLRLAQLPPANLAAELLRKLDLNVSVGLQCLATLFGTARRALTEAFLRWEVLAAAFYGAGSRAAGVADLASVVFSQGCPGASGPALWQALAAHGGYRSWHDLPASTARMAAIKLWVKRPDFAPPEGDVEPLVRWLAQADGDESEKSQLQKEVERRWELKQSAVAAKVEDVFAALLQGFAVADASSAALARLIVSSPVASSPWICHLLANGVGEAASGAASALLSSGAAGRSAVLAAWSALQASAFAAACGSHCLSPWPSSVATAFRLLIEICELFAARGCWQQLLTACLCIVCRWPANARDKAVVLEFAREVLFALPGRYRDGRAIETALHRLFSSLPSSQPVLEALFPEGEAPGGAAAGCGPCGLRNLGNTCYLNSFLQALSLTESCVAEVLQLFPPLLDGCAEVSVSAELLPPRGADARRELAKVFTQMRLGPAPVSPSGLAALTPFGLGGRQQDVNEVAHWLLDQLGDAGAKSSITNLCFGLRARTTVRCSSCSHRQENEESLTSLCLPVLPTSLPGLRGGEVRNMSEAIPLSAASASAALVAPTPPEEADVHPADDLAVSSTVIGRSVADLIATFLSEEPLEGYRCDCCHETQTSKRQCEVLEPPSHLLVTLGRFAYSADGQQKVHAHVSVDKALALPCCDGSSAAYVLYAAITHAGDSPNSGHYLCVGRDSTEMWRCYDDSLVSPCDAASQEDLDRLLNGSATAYVLFYRRVQESSRKKPRHSALLVAELLLEGLATAPIDESKVASIPRPDQLQPPLTDFQGDDPDSLGRPGGSSGWIC